MAHNSTFLFSTWCCLLAGLETAVPSDYHAITSLGLSEDTILEHLNQAGL